VAEGNDVILNHREELEAAIAAEDGVSGECGFVDIENARGNRVLPIREPEAK
jgi:hypothetical protein